VRIEQVVDPDSQRLDIMMEKGDNFAGKDGRSSRLPYRHTSDGAQNARWGHSDVGVAYRKSKLANLAAEWMKFSER
jgi:hypothetical protein